MSIAAALASFALITLVIVGTSIMYTYATKGFAFGFSSNRNDPDLSPLGLRLNRSLQNHTESAAYIVPSLIAAAYAGLDGPGVALAAALIVIGRALYFPLYLSGITFIRVPAFVLGTVSSLWLAVMSLIALA